ncbi:multiple epidermal growth factor-like domains protein 11 [Salvelinus fontinalis]|uniref:multiple epidermal growth factor-like domains protein 11 n=1 Tax=Salvelinus fontinalis TaxID=8038 RepID=UPI002485494F|nr:multiple epidermal growth factor-like domains protein 11 [Salvelinus fontinalis]
MLAANWRAALMMDEMNPYTKISPARGGSEHQSAGAVMGIIFLLLLIMMAMLSLFVWFRQRQRDKGHHMQPSVAYTPGLRITNTDYSECCSTVAMRPSTLDVSQTLTQSGSSLSGSCISNPSYHTVSVPQCNDTTNPSYHTVSVPQYSLASTITTNLDSTLTVASSSLKGVRNGSEWRAYCNLNHLEPTVSVLQGLNGMATGFSQNPYDLPRSSHLPSGLNLIPRHYDILPMSHSPTDTPPPPPESPSSLL